MNCYLTYRPVSPGWVKGRQQSSIANGLQLHVHSNARRFCHQSATPPLSGTATLPFANRALMAVSQQLFVELLPQQGEMWICRSSLSHRLKLACGTEKSMVYLINSVEALAIVSIAAVSVTRTFASFCNVIK